MCPNPPEQTVYWNGPDTPSRDGQSMYGEVAESIDWTLWRRQQATKPSDLITEQTQQPIKSVADDLCWSSRERAWSQPPDGAIFMLTAEDCLIDFKRGLTCLAKAKFHYTDITETSARQKSATCLRLVSGKFATSLRQVHEMEFATNTIDLFREVCDKSATSAWSGICYEHKRLVSGSFGESNKL